MSIVLSLLLAALLLAAIVYVLHKNQRKENAESIDRSDPLPPLERSLVDRVETETPDDQSENLAPKARPSVKSSQRNQTIAAKPAEPTVVKAKSAKNWQEQCKTLRDAKSFDEALDVCARHYPQLNAYKQACLVLRAQLRANRGKNFDEQESLRELFRLAATAAFFHEKNEHLPPPMTAARLKELAQDQWNTLQCDYQDIGYQHLNLLTTTDCKLLIAAFGEPAQHRHMREVNISIWQQLNSPAK